MAGTGMGAAGEGLTVAGGAEGGGGLVGAGGGAAGAGAGTDVCAMPGVTIADASMTGSAQPHSIRFIIIKCILDLIPGFIIY